MKEIPIFRKVRVSGWSAEQICPLPFYDPLATQWKDATARIIDSETHCADLISGARVILPVNREHALSMLRVALHYLDNNP